MDEPKNAAKRQVLRYWWMLELFSPQKIPKMTPRAPLSADIQVREWKPGEPLPWEKLTKPPKPLGKTLRVWQHTMYLGVYNLEAIYERLHKAFTDDMDAYDERLEGKSACAGILVDQEGRLNVGSSVLSSALWAIGRIENPGPENPQWADGFTDAQENFDGMVASFDAERNENDEGQHSPLDEESISRLLNISHKASGVGGIAELAAMHVIIETKAVSKKRAGEADADFLNSFFLDELKAVEACDDYGEALTTYLSEDALIDTERRIDIEKRLDVVDEGVLIRYLPKGRWPSNPEHSLALSQQFAVNQALSILAPKYGLMGVNGPPGTGKTTMLRDVLAGNVVERARRLAQLKQPIDAFTSETRRWNYGDYDVRVRQLKPELVGFEMVVASANNAAVENVTTEIPAHTAIHSTWHSDADYFADLASLVLSRTKNDEEAKDASSQAWGLVAARLGNKRNRSDFRSAFWFGDCDSKQVQDSLEDTVHGMLARLKRWRDNADKPKNWQIACAEYLQAEQCVNELIASREHAEERCNNLKEAASREQELKAILSRLTSDAQEAENGACSYQSTVKDAEAARAYAEKLYRRQKSVKPGLWESVTSLGRSTKEWRSKLNALNETLSAAELDERNVTAHSNKLEYNAAQLTFQIEAHRIELTRAQEALTQLRADCDVDEERYGIRYPGEKWTGDVRQLHAPWLDKELNLARSKLFLAAMQLHQDFLANTAREMISGLGAAVDVIAGMYPHDLEPEKLLAAWQTFFLAVPMVSTTFASLGRMFGNIGCEAIGWLFIDEAGQASPQYAVGGIWRAQRVVAVGDPLQLQPVVTIPQKAERDIAKAYGVSSTWLPPQASVQTLADRAALIGTYFPQGDDRLWVSAPLTVHRRCDNPMFKLCNEIAYNNIMVHSVHRANEPMWEEIEPSFWADEPARTRGSHLQENQIRRLERALKYLHGKDIAMTDIIAISPFREVADRLSSLSHNYPGLRAGTIHTAQGREAPVVILVLGGDPERRGAKDWASMTVNLVNVAVSRAQRRLYVIGDRDEWMKHNYFRQLSKVLPVKGQLSELPEGS
ncbi:MAG: AAA domain-containing protein [Coriobacteriia bacterium]|nr:AAA domain-containing protein [Coriobacteriia bacterium]MCL2749517.1 AAA domain-containing protein [Coriobacteriia bacterium]